MKGGSGVDISTVDFSAQQLNITPDLIVSGSFSRVQKFLSEEPNKETLGPFEASDVIVRRIKTRAMVSFPSELLELLLGADLTARQVSEIVVPDLVDAGL
jgi:hypothetical protein